jgi:hypothetical protein
MEDIIKNMVEKEIERGTIHRRLYEESLARSTNEKYIRTALEQISTNDEIIEALSNNQAGTTGFMLARKHYAGELGLEICKWCRKTSHLTDAQFQEDLMEKRDLKDQLIKAFDDYFGYVEK